MGYSWKNQNMDKRLRTWNSYSRGVEERAHENPTVQLKEKRNSLRFKKKLIWNFLGSWFLTLELGDTQFYKTSMGGSLFSPEFLKVKWQNKYKNSRGGFSEKYIHNPTCLHLFWNSPMDRWFSCNKSNFYYSSMAIGTIPEKNPDRGEGRGLEIYWGHSEKI